MEHPADFGKVEERTELVEAAFVERSPRLLRGADKRGIIQASYLFCDMQRQVRRGHRTSLACSSP